MICPSCHTENRDGAKFCDECGAKLPRAAFEQIEGAEPAQALSIIDNEERTEDEAVPDMHEGDAENAEAADGGQDGDDVDSEAVVQFDDASTSGEDAENAGDMACSNEEAAAGDADDDDSSDIAMQDDSQPQQDVTESSQEAEEDAANQFEGSHGDADDVAHQRTHVLDLPDIRNLAFESEKTQTLGPKPASPAIKSGWEPDLSGFDEFLVYPGYVPPKAAWHSGDTMQMPRIEGVEPPKQKDFKAPDARKSAGRGKKAAIIIALVLVLAAAAAAGVTYYLEMWGGKVIPDVTGMTQSDATYLLQNKGFTVRATTVPSDSTEGLVLLMDPGAGARQEEGSEVVIHVSTSRTVPAVVGKTQDDAAKALADSGFENVTVTTERSDEAEGTVLSVNPGEGEKAKASTAITLTVAEAYTVPDITGMTYREAVSAIEGAGLQAASTYTYNETVPEGTLLGSDPQAGSKASSDTVVTINIAKSRGSELTQAARAYLASNTLKASDNSTFTVSSVDSVTYQGDNTVSFTATGRASTSVTVLGQTLSVSGDAKQVSGTITFDSSDNVTSVSFQ